MEAGAEQDSEAGTLVWNHEPQGDAVWLTQRELRSGDQHLDALRRCQCVQRMHGIEVRCDVVRGALEASRHALDEPPVGCE